MFSYGCSTKDLLSCFLPNDLAVDSTAHAVLELEVHLGNGVLWEDRGVGDIADGSRFNHVADLESPVSILFFIGGRPNHTVNLFIALSFGVQREQLEHLQES